ncbi:MAG: hypothetical protein R3251_04395 [Candidatus Spechtbacterales bacterium]|nr:hypothetical protein [Candidatus Spechtbacterales bacterium]
MKDRHTVVVTITEEQLAMLDDLAQMDGNTLSAQMQRAIDEYPEGNRPCLIEPAIGTQRIQISLLRRHIDKILPDMDEFGEIADEAIQRYVDRYIERRRSEPGFEQRLEDLREE